MKKILGIVLILSLGLGAEKIAVIEIQGMTCPLCTVAIKRSLQKTPGVFKAKVKLNTRRATVRFQDDLDTSKLLEAIRAAGGYEGKILSVKPSTTQKP
ncbi:heavy-metal-associated domain-containing protein [Nitratifractor sp.]